MTRDEKPHWVEDGLLIHRDAAVCVCDAEDTEEGGFDVHLCVGDDDRFDHIYFDSNATLYSRATLEEAWTDAADWLYKEANTLMELRNYILANDIGCEEESEE